MERDKLALPISAPHLASRRDVLKGMGVLVALGVGGSMLGACSSGGSAKGGSSGGGSKTLVYAGFGGNYQDKLEKAILNPFERATGIKVQAVTGADSLAQLKAMVQSGNVSWDIMDLTGETLGLYQAGNLLEKFDYSKVHQPKLVDSSIAQPYGMGYYTYSHNIWWNASVIKSELNSWADVWDVKNHPGKRGFLNQPEYSPEEAMLASGVSLSQVYPLDLDKIFRMYDQIRSSAVFLEINPLNNQITQGDVITGDLNLARIKSAIAANAPIKYNWKQTIVDVNRFGIPKGAPHQDNAYKLINFALQPEQQRAIFEIFVNYSPVVESVFSSYSKDQQAQMAGSPVNASESVYISPGWYAEHGAELTQRFTKWLSGG